MHVLWSEIPWNLCYYWNQQLESKSVVFNLGSIGAQGFGESVSGVRLKYLDSKYFKYK